ncbi:TRAP transporter permease [Halococcus saccharolyticus]|uniref:TRAP-type transport system permease protein n=1 Tax=Halococcus saccharolyticus DSM 5350 TaxID=1227455 RepID=M0MH28_9EURY|nr:TRAP transporter fused permease subunit [Halococcus saccharolyticus]EMA43740.1 TRAP-type transport system permease protein [Halococcus saccharolyticus DSM 5350]
MSTLADADGIGTAIGDAVNRWTDERTTGELTLRAVIGLFAVTLSLYTFYFAYSLVFVRVRHSNIFLGVGLAIFFLYEAQKHLYGTADVAAYRDRKTAPEGSVLSRVRSQLGRFDGLVMIIEAAGALLGAWYVESNFDRLLNDAVIVGYTQQDYLMGLLIIVVVTDATRRAYGWAITSVVLFTIAYALAGPWLPGFLGHTGMTWQNVARYGAIGLSGTYGFILGIGTTWVAVFIIFAGMAKTYGALEYILNGGQRLGNYLRTGVVQVAVIASMAMGSITGSAAANTATTGSFTIPMMQDQGVRDDFAAAIESVASSGGQMMPPVMGVAAFIMADILGVSYVEIIRAALIPALLFYFSVGIGVQFVVLRFGWTAEQSASGTLVSSLFSRDSLVAIGYVALVAVAFAVLDSVIGLSALFAGLGALGVVVLVRLLQALIAQGDPTAARAEFAVAAEGFFEGPHFLVPMAVLVYTLVVMRLTPLSAGLYTAVTLVATIVVRCFVVDSLLRAPVTATVQTVKGLRSGAIEMAPLVGVLAAMGIIISMLTQTGLSSKISIRMVGLAGGVFIAVLLMAMFLSILFGLGMPTPAAYILVVILVAPGIIEVGVPELTAHLFVFYFAMLSAITPPVAVAVAVGSRIADANFIQTGIQALRIGVSGFFIPFAFISNASLIYWTFPGTLVHTTIVFVGVVGLIASTTAYDGKNVLSAVPRFVYFGLALIALYAPMTIVQAMAAMLIGVGLVFAQMDQLPATVTPVKER